MNRRVLEQVLQFLCLGIRFDFKAGPNVLISGPDFLIQTKKPPQIKVSFEMGLNGLYSDPTRRSVVDQARRHTGSQRMQKILDWVGSTICTQKHIRLVGIKNERRRPGTIFSTNPVEGVITESGV